MPKYCCKICNYFTNKKCNYKKHLSTTKHINRATIHDIKSSTIAMITGNHTNRDNNVADLQNQNISQLSSINPNSNSNTHNIKSQVKVSKSANKLVIQESFKCEFCGQLFTKKTNLYRHRKKFCKKNPDKLIEKISNLEKMSEIKDVIHREELLSVKEENLDIREELIKEKEKNNKQPNNGQPANNNGGQGNAAANNNINGNHNNINNNQIVVNNFPQANRNHVTDAQYLDAFKQPTNMIPILFKISRCDDNVPENYNMWLCNKKTREILVYEDGVWVDKGCDSSLTEAIYDEMDNVQTVSQRLKDDGTWDQKMLPDQTKTFDNYIERYDKETDVPLVNQPHKQQLLNDAKDKVFCTLKSYRHKKPKQ